MRSKEFKALFPATLRCGPTLGNKTVHRGQIASWVFKFLQKKTWAKKGNFDRKYGMENANGRQLVFIIYTITTATSVSANCMFLGTISDKWN